MRRPVLSLMTSIVVLWLSVAVGLAEPNIQDTRLLSQPALSAQHVAFIYANNLWVADLDGKNVRRLTSELEAVSNPVFSPDGSVIAGDDPRPGNGILAQFHKLPC